MATHPNILAWRIPWTERPGRPQSIGSQRVRHDQSDLALTHVWFGKETDDLYSELAKFEVHNRVL